MFWFKHRCSIGYKTMIFVYFKPVPWIYLCIICFHMNLLLQGHQERRLKHYHYQTWPDADVPQDPESLMRFIHVVRDQVDKRFGPIVVHCRYANNVCSWMWSQESITLWTLHELFCNFSWNSMLPIDYTIYKGMKCSICIFFHKSGVEQGNQRCFIDGRFIRVISLFSEE